MWWFKKKTEDEDKLIGVRPKNYRSIALYAIENCKEPIVWMENAKVCDYSENGILVQKRIRECVNFLIMDGNEQVLGFHDHPDEMWISEKYRHIAEHCANEGWLKIDIPT
jgi:hypothetical protein